MKAMSSERLKDPDTEAQFSLSMSIMSTVIYFPDLSGGGAERLHTHMVGPWVDMGINPSFLLDHEGGALMDAVPGDVPVVVLKASRPLAALPKLIRFFRHSPPDILISNMEHMNVVAVIARTLARAKTKIIVTQHNALSQQVMRRSLQWRHLPALYRWILPHADAIIAVSNGVADDLANVAHINHNKIDVIHNGVIDDNFSWRASQPVDHPWFFAGSPPVIVGMGRLVAQKDFATLIRAFGHIADRSNARLMILGEGDERGCLETLIVSLGLQERVALPGFVKNPLPILRRAALFVMSSRFEGFGNVIAEALALGTSVVSTDCPHGPEEILQGGRYGTLVPVGDDITLAAAIVAKLANPDAAEKLIERGHHFSVQQCAENYALLFKRIIAA